MRFGSLFAGIGGMDLGLERAGMTPVWQVEIDGWCQKVLAKHWPDVARYGDVRDCGAHNLAPVDLICGGFPCQDLSYAGRGAGITGERSDLWSEYARIIGELRPRYVLVENVTALLGRGMDVVCGDLAALGYDAEWSPVSACSVGASHMRFRLFIVGYSSSTGLERPIGQRDESARRPGKELTRPPRWAAAPRICRGADGVPHWMDRIRGLGNAVVPQVAEWVGSRIMEHERLGQ